MAAKGLHALLQPELYGAHPGSREHAAMVEELRAEARQLVRLRHPHIVLFMGMTVEAESQTPQWIVTERADGCLADLLSRDGPVSVQRALALAEHVLSGLAYMHRLGVVHRDLKPANILVFGSGESAVAKIGDVGLSRVKASTTMSAQGTMYYMAPEMLEGRTCGGRGRGHVPCRCGVWCGVHGGCVFGGCCVQTTRRRWTCSAWA